MISEPTASRVLWVTEEPPGRQLGGGSIRQAHLFQAVAASVPTDLWVVGKVDDQGVREAAAHLVELPKDRALWSERRLVRRILQLTLALGSRLPGQVYFARPGRRALGRALRDESHGYDLVIVEHEALAPLIRRRQTESWLLDLHHLVSVMAEQERSLARRFRERWLLATDARKARALEQRIVRAYDRVLVCSDDDAAALRRLEPSADEAVSVVPNGVDLARFAATPIPSHPRLLFPGTLSYLPNVDGARWFCTEVLPRIRATEPHAELQLVGQDPAPEVMELGDLPGVSLHADVPSMAPYFEAARVVVVPLRIGTGTRLKVLEAMASGRPVVGTEVGLEGVGIIDRTNALVADRPEEMAAAIGELLADDNLCRRLAKEGRTHTERHFGWEGSGERLVELVSELLSGRVVDRRG